MENLAEGIDVSAADRLGCEEAIRHEGDARAELFGDPGFGSSDHAG